MNNKGFTLVEIIATVAIIGILSTIAITSVTRYKVRATEQAFLNLALSVTDSAENYLMDNPGFTCIELNKLKDQGYISSLNDPGSKGSSCTGKIVIIKCTTGDAECEAPKKYTPTPTATSTPTPSANAIDKYKYEVHLWCTNEKILYKIPSQKKTKEAASATSTCP